MTKYIKGKYKRSIYENGSGYHIGLFKVIDSEEINAFANGENELCVYTGLLKYVTDDTELAGVIAHEIGHILNSHVAKQSIINAITATAVNKVNVNDKVKTGAAIVQNLSMKKLSRDEETEADVTGVDLMTKAGYNPLAMVSVLYKISGNYVDILEDHPSGDKRTMYIYDYITYTYPDKAKLGYSSDSYKQFMSYATPIITLRNSSPKLTKKFNEKQEKLSLSTEAKNTDDNMYNKIVSEFYKLILNQNLFESFVTMFIPCLVDESYDKNKKISILKHFNSLFQKKSEIRPKILSSIDYYKFILQNILNDNNHTLSNISINFLIDSYQSQVSKKLIEESFCKILDNFKDLEFTNNGFNNFVKLLSIINLDKEAFKEKVLTLVTQCLKNIEKNKYQTNELTYLNTFLFLNNYPSDSILINNNLLEEEKSSNSPSNENSIWKKDDNNNNNLLTNNSKQQKIKILNGINYRGNIQFHKEFLQILLCMEKTFTIEELHLYFDDSKQVNPSIGYNFRLQIYSIEGEKDFDIKSSKYYYDHTWRLLTKTYGKTKLSQRNKDLKDKYYSNDEENQAEEAIKNDPIKELSYVEKHSNVIKINFKKWNNEFNAHYINIDLSINDGTKEANSIPNLLVFPVIIGQESKAKGPSIEQLEKFYTHFSLSKKAVYSRIPEVTYCEGGFDKKRIMIEYNDVNKNKVVNEENKSKDKNENELSTLYSQLKSKNKEIEKKVQILVDKKKSKEEKEKVKNDINELCKNIELLQSQINEFNPNTKLEKSHSFNIQLIKILIMELNSKKDLDLGDMYNIIIQLIDIILFNQVFYHSFYEQIFNFIDIYFYKKVSKEEKEKFKHPFPCCLDGSADMGCVKKTFETDIGASLAGDAAHFRKPDPAMAPDREQVTCLKQPVRPVFRQMIDHDQVASDEIRGFASGKMHTARQNAVQPQGGTGDGFHPPLREGQHRRFLQHARGDADATGLLPVGPDLHFGFRQKKEMSRLLFAEQVTEIASVKPQRHQGTQQFRVCQTTEAGIP